MYKKRVMAIVISAIMVFSVFSTTVFAEETSVDSWDGTADTSWYQDGISEFHLTTAEQLAGLAKIVNETGNVFQGVTVYLDTDVDLSGHEWVSIGTGNNVANYFGGTFDGQSKQRSIWLFWSNISNRYSTEFRNCECESSDSVKCCFYQYGYSCRLGKSSKSNQLLYNRSCVQCS